MATSTASLTGIQRVDGSKNFRTHGKSFACYFLILSKPGHWSDPLMAWTQQASKMVGSGPKVCVEIKASVHI